MKRLVGHIILILAAFLLGPALRLFYIHMPVPRPDSDRIFQMASEIDAGAPSEKVPGQWGDDIVGGRCSSCHLEENISFTDLSPAKIYSLITNGTGNLSFDNSHIISRDFSSIERWATAISFYDKYITRAHLNPSYPDPEAAGGVLYNTYCLSCHGKNGYGNGYLSPDFTRRPSNLRDTAWLARQSDEQLFVKIKYGINSDTDGFTGMPYFGDFLSDDEIYLIVNYLRTFSYESGPAPEKPSSIYSTTVELE
ncbi:MAG TPA: cytochrome c [bacterium]|jgi:mono/diheme cytochrome c family protein